jgi:L-rhamnose isomerase
MCVSVCVWVGGSLDDDATSKLLSEAFTARLQVVMDLAQHARNVDVSARVSRLDHTEQRCACTHTHQAGTRGSE